MGEHRTAPEGHERQGGLACECCGRTEGARPCFAITARLPERTDKRDRPLSGSTGWPRAARAQSPRAPASRTLVILDAPLAWGF